MHRILYGCRKNRRIWEHGLFFPINYEIRCYRIKSCDISEEILQQVRQQDHWNVIRRNRTGLFEQLYCNSRPRLFLWTPTDFFAGVFLYAFFRYEFILKIERIKDCASYQKSRSMLILLLSRRSASVLPLFTFDIRSKNSTLFQKETRQKYHC